MNENDTSSERYMKLFGWEGNPFVFKILPDLFVGYEKEMSSLTGNLSGG